MRAKKKWFTFVELIIASVILIILISLWFFNYSKYINISRDSERKTNIANISAGLKSYKQNKGIIPLPWDYFTLTNSWTEVGKQWKLNKQVSLSELNNLPLDPSLKIPYLYSITKNRQEFQIATTLENKGKAIAFVDGNFKSISKNILPSLLIAYNGINSVDISINPYKNMFILDGIGNNLPYSLENAQPINSSWTLLSSLLNNPNTKLWQNTDYRSCQEICNAGKSIWDGEYQILTETGGLVNVNCIFEGEKCETGI